MSRVYPRLQRAITKVALLIASLTCSCDAQTQQANTATCSNVVINGGVATFSCSGLTPEQAKLLHDIPSFLVKMLRQEKQDNADIMARLNDCIEQGAPRSITPGKRDDLIKQLRPIAGQQLYVAILAPNSTPESSRYAEQLYSLFRDAGWHTQPVSHTSTGGSMPDAIGLTATVRNEEVAVAVKAKRLRDAAGIQMDFKYDPTLPDAALYLTVGGKPIP
jgi:hypothetical protein